MPSLIVLVMVLMILRGLGTSSSQDLPLLVDFYQESCPLLEKIVRYNVKMAVLNDPRAAASLLRLHFHDCFVMGCDGSILLDTYGGIKSEKQANPNLNSARGFEIIDQIKHALEEACPLTVSCADILAIVAREAVVLTGGPSWEVPLGRRDSLKASFDGANKFIPTPNLSFDALIANFAQQGLDLTDLIALSGAHTIGRARCVSFRKRIYDTSFGENLDYNRYSTFQRYLQSLCPQSGGDNRIASLDFETSNKFDNYYYQNLLEARGLLHTDNVLVMEDGDQGKEAFGRVWEYARNRDKFFESFSRSMIKMGYINVLTGFQGQIRKDCRFVNA